MAEQPDVKEAPAKEDITVAQSGQDAAVRKVELDLDDAPFLKEEKPAVPATASTDDVATASDAPEEENINGKKKKKKIFLIAGAAASFVVVAGAVLWWFVLRTPPPPPPPLAPSVEPKVIVVPSQPAAPPATIQSVKELTTFVIPRQTAQGTRFLVCKFATLNKDPLVATEIEHKLIPLRDALYFYLSSKSDEFLTAATNAAKVKQELMGVVNDYITRGKVEDILFESYLNE